MVLGGSCLYICTGLMVLCASACVRMCVCSHTYVHTYLCVYFVGRAEAVILKLCPQVKENVPVSTRLCVFVCMMTVCS